MDLCRRLVSEIMSSEVVTLAPHETLDLGQDIMRLGRVRHIPVVDESGRLVGIVSNRDLLEASLSKALDFDARSRRTFLRSVEAGEVMAKEVVAVGPEADLEEAARLLVQRKIGCLPVVDKDGTLLGLVTETDLLAAAFLPERASGEREGRAGTIDVGTETGRSHWIRREFDELRRMRDELEVRIHLARADLRDEWQKLEGGLRDLERHTKQVARAAKQPLHRLEADARQLARDLRDGYRRIRDAL
jgi:CBS domain-containing protein